MGTSEFLTGRVNEELQRAFEAGVPASQVYHIGTPSEHTTSEGFRSVVSQRTPSVQSHPTSSPISFGPSTPVQSASAAPAGLLSSPGGMSDVGSTLIALGLPLRDPPRMAGSYGVSLNDPVFGMSSGSIPCENPGHRPVPAQAPIPPPPPQQGVVLLGDLLGSRPRLILSVQRNKVSNTLAVEKGTLPKGSGAKIALLPCENHVRRLQTFFTVVLEPNIHTFSVLSETLPDFLKSKLC